MNKDQWKPYGVVEDLSGFWHFEELKHADGKLVIILSAEKRSKFFSVEFTYFFSYRYADEGDMLEVFSKQQNYQYHPIFRVENSSYLEWFYDQTFNTKTNMKLEHYRVTTPNEVIEIIAGPPPKIRSNIHYLPDLTWAVLPEKAKGKTLC